DRLRKYIDDKIENFRIVVADPNVTAIGYEQQTFILQGHLEADQSLLELSFIQPADGFETARVVRGYDKPVHRVLGRDEPAVAAALGGSNYFGPVFFAEGKPMIVLASPVINQQGSIIGVLRGEANLAAVVTLVAQANLGASGYVYVVTQEGRVLAASSAAANRLTVGEDRRALPFVSQVLAMGVSPSVNTTATVYSAIAGESVFTVGRTIPKFGWAVVAEWPVGEAMAVVREVVQGLVAGALVFLVFLVVLSIWLARRFTKPLRQLTMATAQVGQGKFDVVLPTAGRDEVGELARSFGTMTQGLKELERLKDEFVFIAAHELRTPVTAIRGYAEMLGDATKDLPEQTKEFVTRLQQSGQRLATLVNDLLEVARSQAGRLKVQTSPQDLTALVSVTLAELKPLAMEKRHELVFSPPPAFPF
ncbi:MAG: sensor histidine kinase, partial [Candidatus Veblenbacteria bacterium]|nr:sensor histidine kinase [Candidatus Veblenbacteria bacterium]